MYRETLTLKSDKPIEAELLKELGNRLQQRGIEVYILDVDTYCLEMCHKLIMEKGPGYILSLERLQEAVLPSKDRQRQHRRTRPAYQSSEQVLARLITLKGSDNRRSVLFLGDAIR